MELTISKTGLQDAVAQAERIAGKHLSLPVLRCVLVIAEGKEVVLRATNLDLALESRIPANIKKEGVVAIPADTLSAFLHTTPHAENITIVKEESHIVLSTEKTTTKMRTFSHEDFPIIPAIPTQTIFSVKGGEFAGGLKSVWFAASSGSIKAELSSVYVYGEGGELVCVGTDSFRLAEKKLQAKIDDAFEGILIPLKNVNELSRHLESAGNATAQIVSDGHQIGVTIHNTYLSSRTIEGNFPDYRQILPKEYETQAIILKQDMVDALKQSRIFSDAFNKVNARFDADDKTVTLTTVNPETGESSITLEGAVTGESLDLNFNHAYWADALQSIKTDSIAIELAGAGKPARIRSVGDQSFTYIVMPMNR
ncbi:MAG TPA: DNA polymerase III subunit beta [Candidatus Paceibacterota bacterium]|nr:DNA polymerase III subunit beta [Candidatus Paceibacterota bacterium]